MYNIIRDYCENDIQNGLFLLDMPTGFGKTYSVLRYIFEACQKEENKNRHYFFITLLKKNLPIAELWRFFKKAGKESEFKQKVLFLDSNSEMAVRNFSKIDMKEIPEEIRKTEACRNFEQELFFLQKKNRSNDFQMKQVSEKIEQHFRDQTEPAFRRLIQKVLFKEFKTVQKRLLAVKTQNRWKWLGTLYPSVFTSERQIIFMSIDKFLVRNAVIVEPSYMFRNSVLIQNAVIFIDEFDSTKEWILKNMIQTGLRSKIDFIELFKAIYSAMHTSEFPAVLTTASQQREKSSYYKYSLQSVLEETRKKADEIYNMYALQFSHCTKAENEDVSKNFLFQDHQFHSVVDGANKYIATVSNAEEKINFIQFTDKKPASDAGNVHVMLGKLRGFIRWF